jgi:hypothetical protein
LLSPLAAFIVALALVAGVFAVYSPALNFQFILDDHRFAGDPRLLSGGHVGEYFTSYAWAQTPGGPLSFYRPLFLLWLRLNVIFTGVSPWGWHLLSILKHAVAAFLLGWLTWKLLRDRTAVLLAAGLFALHPAQTESVAWVTVPDPLMCSGVLGSLILYLLYLRSVERDSESHATNSVKRKNLRQTGGVRSGHDYSIVWLIASAVACIAGLMAKETAVVVPIIIFGFAAITTSGTDTSKAAVKQESTAFHYRILFAVRQSAPFLLVTALYMGLRTHALKGQLSAPTQNLPWKTLLLSWPATLWFYVKAMCWSLVPHAFADPVLVERFSLRAFVLPLVGVCCAAAVVSVVCIWASSKARRELSGPARLGVQRAVRLGWLMLTLPILLTLNLNALNPGDMLHGRYTYLPLAGLMLLIATALRLTNKSNLYFVTGVLVAAVFALLTVRQESAWKDDLTVFTVAHEYAPRNEVVTHGLAKANVQAALGLDEQGRCEEAIPLFDQSIQQYPHDWFAYAGRGECLYKLKDFEGAEASLRQASQLSHEPRVIDQWQQLRAQMGMPVEK